MSSNVMSRSVTPILREKRLDPGQIAVQPLP
jgi:hypothetical protein